MKIESSAGGGNAGHRQHGSKEAGLFEPCAVDASGGAGILSESGKREGFPEVAERTGKQSDGIGRR